MNAVSRMTRWYRGGRRSFGYTNCVRSYASSGGFLLAGRNWRNDGWLWRRVSFQFRGCKPVRTKRSGTCWSVLPFPFLVVTSLRWNEALDGGLGGWVPGIVNSMMPDGTGCASHPFAGASTRSMARVFPAASRSVAERGSAGRFVPGSVDQWPSRKFFMNTIWVSSSYSACTRWPKLWPSASNQTYQTRVPLRCTAETIWSASSIFTRGSFLA